MNLGFELTPEQQIAVTVEEHTERIKEVEADLANLREVIKGNGDPKKSLIWLITDMGTLITSQSTLINAHYNAYEAHVSDGHGGERRDGPWTRIAFGAAQQAIGLVVAAMLFLVALGLVTYLQTGKHL